MPPVLVALPPLAFVAFLQNHDQVANSAHGRRLHQLTSPGRFRAMTALLLLALVLQGNRYRDHWKAARILRAVEYFTQQMVRAGQVDPGVLWRHVRLLQEAARLNQAEAAIPLAEGSQYRLLQRGEEAVEAE